MLFRSNPGTSLITGIGSLFGASNVYLVVRLTDYFAASTELNAFLHTWSLGVEEQFYLLFPLLVWFSGFGRSRPHAAKKLVIFLLPILVASLVSFCILYPHHQPQAYFLIASRFWELAMGSLVFVACRYTNSIRNWWPGPVSLLSLAGLMATFLFPLKLALAATVIAVLLASLLILSLDRSSVSYRILSWPPLVTTGLLSYSLYLWHWPVLVISRWTVGITPFTVPFQVGLIVLFSWLS